MLIANIRKYHKFYILIFIFMLSMMYKDNLSGLLSNMTQEFGLLTPLILGYFYSISLTSGVAAVAISTSQDNSFLFSALSAIGSALADLTILKIIKIEFEHEVKAALRFIDGKISLTLKRFLGLLVIGTPLPDEIGVAMILQSGKISNVTFLLLSMCSNFIFIYLITNFF